MFNRDIFEKGHSIEALLQAIFFFKNQQNRKGNVLIFIDEIQNCPQAVSYYADQKNIIGLNSISDSLIVSYLDDVEKYARNSTMATVIRHANSNAFYEAGDRIKFQGFGNSNYNSREMSEALKVLEKAMLIYLLYPSSSVSPPLQPNTKKSPRLQVLDTGMLNYFAGFQKDLFSANGREV